MPKIKYCIMQLRYRFIEVRWMYEPLDYLLVNIIITAFALVLCTGCLFMVLAIIDGIFKIIGEMIDWFKERFDR